MRAAAQGNRWTAPATDGGAGPALQR